MTYILFPTDACDVMLFNMKKKSDQPKDFWRGSSVTLCFFFTITNFMLASVNYIPLDSVSNSLTISSDSVPFFVHLTMYYLLDQTKNFRHDKLILPHSKIIPATVQLEIALTTWPDLQDKLEVIDKQALNLLSHVQKLFLFYLIIHLIFENVDAYTLTIIVLTSNFRMIVCFAFKWR